MNTPARRKAAADFHRKREAEGLKKVTVWLSAPARFKLDALKAAAGSKDKAIDQAIMAWEGPKMAAPKPPAAQKVSTDGVQVGPTKPKPGQRLKGRT